MGGSEKNEASRVEDIQWLHFAAVDAGSSLDEIQQTFDGKLGVLGKRLPDALADLFMTEDAGKIEGRELLAFDAEDDYAWINPHKFYLVPAGEVTTEYRFQAHNTWRALVGAVAMHSEDEPGTWFALEPRKKNFKKLKDSRAFKSDTIDTIFHVMQLLVRGVAAPAEREADEDEVRRLIEACRKKADLEAAQELEAVAWGRGDVNLWRWAMAVADGKSYLARMFEDRIEL